MNSSTNEIIKMSESVVERERNRDEEEIRGSTHSLHIKVKGLNLPQRMSDWIMEQIEGMSKYKIELNH